MSKTIAELASDAEKILGIRIVLTDKFAAYYAPETDEGYWLTRDDLAYAADCEAAYPGKAYSHWAGATGKVMSDRARRRIFGR